MLRKDKIPTRGAPSLLTPAQQAEAERNRILSTLEESDGARKRTSKPSPGAARGTGARAPWMWGMSALLLAAVAGGAGLWYGQQAAQAPVVVAATAQPEPVVVPVAASSAEAAPAPALAATIQDDNGVHADAPGGQSLSDMLDAAPVAPAGAQPAATHAAASVADTSMLSQALEAPSGAALAAAAAAPVALKVAQTSAPESASRAAPKSVPTKPKPVVKKVAKRPAKPAAAPDNDALLLSALIAHSQAAEPASKKARPSLERELGNCRKLPKGQQPACRERACEGRTAGLCKVSQ